MDKVVRILKMLNEPAVWLYNKVKSLIEIYDLRNKMHKETKRPTDSGPAK